MQCWCGDNTKYGLLSKCFFQRTQEHDGWKKCQGYFKRLLEILSFSYQIENKTSIKHLRVGVSLLFW